MALLKGAGGAWPVSILPLLLLLGRTLCLQGQAGPDSLGMQEPQPAAAEG